MTIKNKFECPASLYLTNLVQDNEESFTSIQSSPHAREVSKELPSEFRPGYLDSIDALNEQFERRYDSYFSTDPLLSRGLVSFQANKSRAVYRWYKYKEAFSAGLVEYLLTRYGIKEGTLLDPFAGSGTALFASSEAGLSAEGIELLPIGQCIVETNIDSSLAQGPPAQASA